MTLAEVATSGGAEALHILWAPVLLVAVVVSVVAARRRPQYRRPAYLAVAVIAVLIVVSFTGVSSGTHPRPPNHGYPSNPPTTG